MVLFTNNTKVKVLFAEISGNLPRKLKKEYTLARYQCKLILIYGCRWVKCSRIHQIPYRVFQFENIGFPYVEDHSGIANNSQQLNARFNGITTSTYRFRRTGESGGSGVSVNQLWVGGNNHDTINTSNRRSYFLLDLPYYTETNARKVFLSRGFSFMAGQSWSIWNGGENETTSAITSVQFFPVSPNFLTNTIIELYGWKGA